jgi:DNA-binding NarL/FixJ family response regulator
VFFSDLCVNSRRVVNCLETTVIRILFVEDFKPFRAFVTTMLGRTPHLRVICEASDGLEAVTKAWELHPDLILMDIGLPKLNGLQAARRIRALLPSSKIVFLSQETDIDIVEEAFSLGACDFIGKAQAAELVTRLESAFSAPMAVCRQQHPHEFCAEMNS